MVQVSSDRQLTEAIEAARTAILEAPSVPARFAALTRTLAGVGLDQISYAFIDPAVADRADTDAIFFSTMDPAWVDHYFANGLSVSDPHYLRLQAGNLSPYLWGDTQIRNLQDPAMRSTATGMAEAGQRSAICTPFVSPLAPTQPIACIALGSSAGEKDLAGVVGLNAWRLSGLVHLFHHLSLGELHRQSMGLEPLTSRERDCLRFSADGMLQGAIAHRMRIALPTVEVHLRNARRKLKARTLPQAIGRAIALGEIPPA